MFRILFVFCLLTLSCSKPLSIDRDQISGYWEIRSVTMPGGTEKEFDLNTIIEYIEVNGDSGIRTKVIPSPDGSFINNGIAEDFTLRQEGDSLRMQYQTDFDKWEEIILKADEHTLILLNQDQKTYTYSRYEEPNFQYLKKEQ